MKGTGLEGRLRKNSGESKDPVTTRRDTRRVVGGEPPTEVGRRDRTQKGTQ